MCLQMKYQGVQNATFDENPHDPQGDFRMCKLFQLPMQNMDTQVAG